MALDTGLASARAERNDGAEHERTERHGGEFVLIDMVILRLGLSSGCEGPQVR
jgi:hypothetical protein